MDANIGETAGLFAVIFGLFRVLEHVVPAALKKIKNGNGSSLNGKASVTVVQLDPEISSLLKETRDRVLDIEQIISIRDGDGTPMVYSPRQPLSEIRNISSDVKMMLETAHRTEDSIGDLSSKLDDVAKKR